MFCFVFLKMSLGLKHFVLEGGSVTFLGIISGCSLMRPSTTPG